MQTTLKRYELKKIPLPAGHIPAWETRHTFFHRIDAYIARQQAGENHFRWVGVVMATQAFFITPFLAVIIVVTGNWIPLWFVATASMYATFIPVLSGLSVTQILRTYFINLAASILIIATALVYLVAA